MNGSDKKTGHDLEPFVTADIVCAFLSVSKSTIDRKCRRGELPFYRIGSGKRAARRFRLSEIERAMRAVRH